MASKLEVEPKILGLDINKGFYEFAKEQHLANSLKTQNHKINVNPETNEIQILHEKVFISWTTAKLLIEEISKENKTKIDINEPYSLSIYGYKGIQNKDRYQWIKLQPLLKGITIDWADHFIKDPLIFDSDDKGYIMEFCSSATESTPRKMAGDHSWIRLYHYKKIDQSIKGKMYSIGLYRPYKHHHYVDNFWMPFSLKKGYITYDVSEEWNINDKIKTVAKRIDQESYKKIKNKIQTDQDSDNIVFHLFEHNCDEYISDLGKLGGLNLSNKRHFLELFASIPLKKTLENKLPVFPLPIQSTVHIINNVVQKVVYLFTPLFNFGFFCLGAAYAQKNIKQKATVRAPITSFFDFFKFEKLCPSSPWILANDVKNDVESWRSKKMQKLDLNTLEGMEKKKQITFDFPKSYKIENNS